MKGKPLEMGLLYDFYGGTLTSKQRKVFELYYNEDFSLAEIAEQTGITRQGVRDCVKRAEQVLLDMEQKLGLVHSFRQAADPKPPDSLTPGDESPDSSPADIATQVTQELHALTVLNTTMWHHPELAARLLRLSQLFGQLNHPNGNTRAQPGGANHGV